MHHEIVYCTLHVFINRLESCKLLGVYALIDTTSLGAAFAAPLAWLR
jgi:hypothetical protein